MAGDLTEADSSQPCERAASHASEAIGPGPGMAEWNSDPENHRFVEETKVCYDYWAPMSYLARV